ncbi:hypothetical protein KY342_03785 [Candidatus Woesearchaeota archaeon]|nr:hypothetical protein [Candidatus Woesearchaeota archaeon]
MKDYLDKVKNELKRVDHLLYVSLKYTRTVDVIRSVINRLISAFDFSIDGLLAKVKRRRKTLEIPEQPRKRCALVKELYADDEKILDLIDFYLELRNIYQAKYTKREEYRRYVTLIAELEPGKTIDIGIDQLHEYEKRTKTFVEYLEGVLK